MLKQAPTTFMYKKKCECYGGVLEYFWVFFILRFYKVINLL